MATCNACAIDQGFIEGCGPKPAGGNYVQLSMVPSCYLDSSGITTLNGVITAIALDTTTNPTAQWYTIKVRKDTLSTNEVRNESNGSIQQNITFTLGNYSDSLVNKETAAAEQSEFLNALNNNDEGMVLVIRDKNGVRRLYGETTGLAVTASDKQSGLVSTDVTGTVITLSEAQPAYAKPLAAALVASAPDNINLIPGS